ncbi:hypothetical protein BSL78_24598 [Apostichopus japonicus]|uniref:Uncharacterized protein n=1 Tax=Stichopus japonicus TaxID=307972 RepID=A0A2G8JS58_STIJA|nr:hypothetical protein BSL78_24598 [Apostichopus japonicus]
MAAAQPPNQITPEVRDNETNQLTEVHVPSAINMVLASPVQSYEQFMDSFMYLKKEDVDEFIPGMEEYPEENLFQRDMNEERERSAGMHDTALEQNLLVPRRKADDKEVENLDDLETEELGEGYNSLTTPRQRLPQQKYVKVDNFLDEMSSEEDDSDDLSFEDISDLLEDSADSLTFLDAKQLTIGMKDSIEKEETDDLSPNRGVPITPTWRDQFRPTAETNSDPPGEANSDPPTEANSDPPGAADSDPPGEADSDPPVEAIQSHLERPIQTHQERPIQTHLKSWSLSLYGRSSLIYPESLTQQKISKKQKLKLVRQDYQSSAIWKETRLSRSR